MEWTAEKVREELPDVTVCCQKETHFCRVAGRQNKFATVYQPQTGRQWEVAWETIAFALNHNVSIQA